MSQRKADTYINREAPFLSSDFQFILEIVLQKFTKLFLLLEDDVFLSWMYIHIYLLGRYKDGQVHEIRVAAFRLKLLIGSIYRPLDLFRFNKSVVDEQ